MKRPGFLTLLLCGVVLMIIGFNATTFATLSLDAVLAAME